MLPPPHFSGRFLRSCSQPKPRCNQRCINVLRSLVIIASAGDGQREIRHSKHVLRLCHDHAPAVATSSASPSGDEEGRMSQGTPGCRILTLRPKLESQCTASFGNDTSAVTRQDTLSIIVIFTLLPPCHHCPISLFQVRSCCKPMEECETIPPLWSRCARIAGQFPRNVPENVSHVKPALPHQGQLNVLIKKEMQKRK